MRIEDTILCNLLHNEEFARKAIPHLSESYFSDRVDAVLFSELSSYFLKYNQVADTDSIKLQLAQRKGISDEELATSVEKLEKFEESEQRLDWLLEKTEAFCKDRAVYNAIMQAILILDGKDKMHNKEAIPSILQSALGVSFDMAVGHSYIDDASDRYDFYTRVEESLPFDIDMLNSITNGGLKKKTLTILLAESGGGKSLVMSHFAASNLRQGKNVLYVTMEMGEERIAERIDANLLDCDIDKIVNLGKDVFETKISNIQAKTNGRLFIKEYPTGAAHTGHIRGLLEELKTKQNFTPDVIYVDYLGICASARVKVGGSVNTYTYLKFVAEELRSLAVEYDVPLVTAGQVNRGGYGSTDIDLTDTSESMGIVMTADLILAMIRTEELDDLGQLMFKQLKNRFSDPNNFKRFVVGLNRSRMKLYDLDKFEQTSISRPEAKFTQPHKLQPKDIAAPTKENEIDLDILPASRLRGFSNFDFS